MKATYGWSISSTPAIWYFYVPTVFIRHIVAFPRCLWATAELQDSWLRGLSFQMGNFYFLLGTWYFFVFGGLVWHPTKTSLSMTQDRGRGKLKLWKGSPGGKAASYGNMLAPPMSSWDSGGCDHILCRFLFLRLWLPCSIVQVYEPCYPNFLTN